MRGPLLLALLLLVAAGHFVVEGLPAYRRAAAALDDLEQRQARFAALEQSLPALSYADLDDLSAKTAALVDRQREGLAALLDDSLAEPLPDFETALRQAPLSALDPLLADLRAQSKASPRASQALAALLVALAESGVTSLQSLELEHSGASRAVPLIDGLVAIDASLTVVGGLHDVLALLERLAPSLGEPVLSVRQATLQRLDPSRWDAETRGPPVRLNLAVAVLFSQRETQG